MNPVAEAKYLESRYHSKKLALEHAIWAYWFVYNPATILFWEKVIKELEGPPVTATSGCVPEASEVAVLSSGQEEVL